MVDVLVERCFRAGMMEEGVRGGVYGIIGGIWSKREK